MVPPVLQNIPFAAGGFPGSVSTPPRSPLYADGIPIAQVTLPPSGTQQAPSGQRFWSSEPRGYGDENNEILVVTLSSPQLINYISLDLPHFPHQASAAYRDADGGWNWITGTDGSPLRFLIAGSVPSQVNTAAALVSGLNPYHYGAGHWIHHDQMITPVTCTGLMISGTRALQALTGFIPGSLPVDASGFPCPYPLGVRGLDFGFRIRQRSDVPWTPRSPDVPTEREPFAPASDINGTPVQLTLRENRASDLLDGLPWKCAPQPSSSAVVNLYADARDSSGAAQVIDRFYIEPTTSGASLNLYYTAAAPAAAFQAVDTPLGSGIITVTGSIPPSPDDTGLTFPFSSGSLAVSPSGCGASLGRPWWMGWEIQPQFPATDSGTYMIFDGGIHQLWYSAGSWLFSLGHGTVLGSWPASHAVNDRLQFAAGWDGSTFSCWNQQGASLMTAPAPELPSSSQFLFGAPQASAWGALTGNFRLTSWIFKQEAAGPDPLLGGIPSPWLAWARQPQQYTVPPSGPGPTTENAVARFDPSLILGEPGSGLAPYGFAGGLGTAWSSCTWTPLQLSYKLTAGYIQFPPVTAVAFRFEFTDLIPQPYDYDTDAPQPAQVFPATAPAAAAPPPPLAPPTASSLSSRLNGPNSPISKIPAAASADTGLIINQQLAPNSPYADAAAQPVPPNPGASLPTEALYATDLLGASHMAHAGGSLFNFQRWQSSPQGAQKQAVTGPQSYQQVSVPQVSRIAYFAGLSQLAMYRADYTAMSDTAEYIDTFGDTAGISAAALAQLPGGAVIAWQWSPGLLTVPVSLPPGSAAQVYSPVYSSAHSVTAIQFAAVQSGPVQLLPDPGFTNTSLPFVASTGDALPLTVSAAASSPLGSLVMVSRQSSQVTWTGVMASYPLWSSFTSPSLTWFQITGANPASAPYGGIVYQGAPVQITTAGRVHIAARVFASQALTAPLVLQLLDGSTGVPIAEEPVSVPAGVVTEWSASFTIGQPQQPQMLTWTQVMAAYGTWALASAQTWGAIDIFIPPLGKTLSWQLVQYGLTSDVWGVDNVSIFEDSIVWEFSNNGGSSWYAAYDVNANPSGALVFPPPLPGQGTQLQWRASGYRPGLTISSLAIRPWYTIYPRGVPPRISGIPHGPNVQAQDYYTGIDKDPYWRTWSNPVPQDWFWTYQQLLRQHTTYQQLPGIPPGKPVLVLSRGLTVPQAEKVLGPETFTDQYSAPYGFYYGTADSSDVYTDNFGNDVYNSDTGYNP